MRSYKALYLLLLAVAYTTFPYAQTWNYYADSAKVFREQAKMDSAICWYQKAIKELSKDSAGTKSYATCCFNISTVYLAMGQYEKAMSMLLESKQIWEKLLGKQHPNYASNCNVLALVYWKMGQYEKAEPLFLESIQIRENQLGKEHPDYGAACNNLACFYMDIGQYEKAKPLLLEAKQVQEKIYGKQHPAYANFCINLATLYQKTGEYKNAETLYIEAKQILENKSGEQHLDYAACCSNLALFYDHVGQYNKAALLLQETKQIREKLLGTNNADYARSCSNLGLVYHHLKQNEKAASLFVEAKQIQQRVLSKQHAEYGISCENLANVFWAMHQSQEAENEFKTSFSVRAHNLFAVFQFTNDKEKTAYINNVMGEDEKAYSFFLSEKILSGQPYSISLFHRNLILSSSEALKKQLFFSKDTAITNRYLEWTKIKKQLSTFYSRPLAERKDDFVNMEEKAGLLEKDLSRRSDAFARNQQQVDWKQIQSKLKPDEASIEFASFHINNADQPTDTIIYVAMLLRKDAIFPVTIPLFTERQLTKLTAACGNKTTGASVQQLYSLTSSTLHGKKVTAASIYELIWKPLEKELAGIKTIYFAPAGMLYKIAFAALPINSKTVLSDRYKLVQLATTASLVDQQLTYITPTEKIELFGDMDYDADTSLLKKMIFSKHTGTVTNRSLSEDFMRGGRWNKLAGTKKEIAGIVSLSAGHRWNTVALTGMNATEEGLKALDGNASPAVLHIATHGFFFPDPKLDTNHQKFDQSGAAFKLAENPMIRSGLLFTGANNAWQNKSVRGIDDGILTAYEVSNLYLPNTKLVVLSACETGLGEIQGSEGVYGLQRAFKIAGVQNLVISLWKVSDLETAAFMELLYKNLFQKQTIYEAFNHAQKTMKNKYRLQPYKWAAWVLVQ